MHQNQRFLNILNHSENFLAKKRNSSRLKFKKMTQKKFRQLKSFNNKDNMSQHQAGIKASVNKFKNFEGEQKGRYFRQIREAKCFMDFRWWVVLFHSKIKINWRLDYWSVLKGKVREDGSKLKIWTILKNSMRLFLRKCDPKLIVHQMDLILFKLLALMKIDYLKNTN